VPSGKRKKDKGTSSVLGADHLDAVADRGYFSGTEILACEQANITVTPEGQAILSSFQAEKGHQ
jgi:hypothetical protein